MRADLRRSRHVRDRCVRVAAIVVFLARAKVVCVVRADVLHLKDGRDVVLEMNDTAFGLMFEHEKEDLDAMRDLILKRCDSLA